MSATFDRYRALMTGDAPAAAGQGVNITWMGNAGVHITDGLTGFMIDPFISRYGMLRILSGEWLPPKHDVIGEWSRKFPLDQVGAVICSHSHYDHALDAPFFAKKFGVPLVGTESTANIGRGAGLSGDEIRVVGDGDRMQIGKFDITFLESVHGPALFNRVPYPGFITRPLVPPAGVQKYRMGGVFGIVIQHPCGTIVHHGSAGYRDAMYAGRNADIVMLGLAGRAGTDEYLRNVIDPLGAPTLVPIHFDNMFKPVNPTFGFIPGVHFDEFLDTCAATRPNLRIVTLPVGIGVGLFPSKPL